MPRGGAKGQNLGHENIYILTTGTILRLNLSIFLSMITDLRVLLAQTRDQNLEHLIFLAHLNRRLTR